MRFTCCNIIQHWMKTPSVYTRIADEELTRVVHITRQTLSFYRESKEAVPVSIAEILDDILSLQSRLLERNEIVARESLR